MFEVILDEYSLNGWVVYINNVRRKVASRKYKLEADSMPLATNYLGKTKYKKIYKINVPPLGRSSKEELSLYHEERDSKKDISKS